MIPQSRFPSKIEETCRAFPWYEALLGSRKDSASTKALPLMNAETLERYYYSESFAEEAYAVYRTSGTSTGNRKAIRYSEEDERHYVDIKARLFARLTEGAGIRRALADMGTGHAAATSLEIFRRLGFEAESIPFEEPIERHIAKLESYRPELLYTMPSILDRIALAAKDPSSFGIRRIILVGEIASPEWRRRAAEQFGIGAQDVIDTYGSIEIGTIAYYSHEHGLYLLTEGVTAEGVSAEELDEGLEPLADNEKVLVLTSFVRDAFPALRFVTYDVVRDLQTVSVDGEETQAFSGIVKRVGKELKHGEKISVYDIEEAVFRHLERAEVRVTVADRKLRVQISSPDAPQDKLPLIQAAIEERIPEIGSMIKGGLLEAIRVTYADPADEAAERKRERPVKGKKLRYGGLQEGMSTNDE